MENGTLFYKWWLRVGFARGGIWHTAVRRNEDVSKAITRAAYEACQRNLRGYSVDCWQCGQPLPACQTLASDNAAEWHRQHPAKKARV